MSENVSVTIERLDHPHYANHWSFNQYRIAVVQKLNGGQIGERHYRDSLQEAEEVKKELEAKYAIRK